LCIGGIDKNLPKPTDSMTDDQLVHCYELLKYLDKKNSHFNLFKKISVTAVKGIEKVCNGETNIFGFKPDLRGFNKQIEKIIRDNRYVVNDFISHVESKVNIGPGMTLLLTICSSAFLQHQKNTEERERKKRKSKGEEDDDEMSDETKENAAEVSDDEGEKEEEEETEAD
jgi:hypothetical protein